MYGYKRLVEDMHNYTITMLERSMRCVHVKYMRYENDSEQMQLENIYRNTNWDIESRTNTSKLVNVRRI